MNMYLVYKSFYDSDFDNQATYYILGLFDNKKDAEKIQQKNYNSNIIEIKKNIEIWQQL